MNIITLTLKGIKYVGEWPRDVVGGPGHIMTAVFNPPLDAVSHICQHTLDMRLYIDTM